MERRDKERMERQRSELKEKGFFTLEDGSLSTDPTNKKKFSSSKSKSKSRLAKATQTNPIEALPGLKPI